MKPRPRLPCLSASTALAVGWSSGGRSLSSPLATGGEEGKEIEISMCCMQSCKNNIFLVHLGISNDVIHTYLRLWERL